MRRTVRLIVFVLAVSMLAGCRLKRPDTVIPPKKMEALLYDYHTAQALAMKLPTSERYKRDLMYNYVFDKHGVTQEQLDTSLVWYTRNPREFAKIYAKLSLKVDKDRQDAEHRRERIEKKSFSVVSGDSVDLWYLPRTGLMTSSQLLDRVKFEVPGDTSFHYGDTLKWTVGTSFQGHSSDSIRPVAYMYISVTYGDSVFSADAITESTCVNEITVVTDKRKAITKIRGAIQYVDCAENDSVFMLLNGVSLLRLHESVAPPELGADNGGGDGHVE